MIPIIFFSIILYQRLTLSSLSTAHSNLKSKRVKVKADFGLLVLGTVSLLTIYFNVTLHRGWFNSDFISPVIGIFS
jgi:hypothetical protein